MNMKNTYKEVKLDNNGKGNDRFYKNPLNMVFQYEYALYAAVSDLFGLVKCKSLCVDSLKMYFLELPHKNDSCEKAAEGASDKRRKKTQESLLAEMTQLVSRDVIGIIIFPMMSVCAAEVRTVLEADGTHSFIFTDGIYGFRLHLDMPHKGRPKGIKVENYGTNVNKDENYGANANKEENKRLESAA